MSHLKYYDYPNFGTRTRREVGSSQAVRADNLIEVAGQGGWDRLTEVIPTDIDAEVHNAFDNVQHTLQVAGGKGWSQVHFVRVYALAEHYDAIILPLIKNLKEWCPDEGHEPVLTYIGVSKLYGDMKIEVEVRAHLGDA